jgi:hypothetical protein
MLVLLLVGGAVTIVSTAVGLARDGNKLLRGRTLPVHAELPREQVGSLPSGVVLTHDLPVTVEVKDPSTTQLLLSTGTAVRSIRAASRGALVATRSCPIRQGG